MLAQFAAQGRGDSLFVSYQRDDASLAGPAFITHQVIEYRDASGAAAGQDLLMQRDQEVSGALPIQTEEIGDHTVGNRQNGNTPAIRDAVKYTIVVRVDNWLSVVQVTGAPSVTSIADAMTYARLAAQKL